jgi:BirA family biotin operon repressor/biotin-[acetyl-CoA-carboxylase] ligase
MDLGRARTDLVGTRFASLDYVEETGSTNADLSELARTGAAEQVLVADHQTAGRGRLGRTWTASPGSSLLMSCLVHPRLNNNTVALVGSALGLAALEAVETLTAARIRLKWPNDLVVGDRDGGIRKLAGVLAEAVVTDAGLSVVAGIGINIRLSEELPADIAAGAASLAEFGPPPDREDLVVETVRGFDRRVTELETSGPEAIIEEFRAVSATLGHRVRVERPAGDLHGMTVDLSPSGSLIVEDADGTRHEVMAGDVTHLRRID